MDDDEALTGAGADEDVQALLRDLAALVPEEAPEPRGALADLLAGKRVLPRQRRSRRTVAGGTALAIGVVLGSGVAAAASNRLPDPAQRAVHDFAKSFLPFSIPAPTSRHHQVVTEPDAPSQSSLPSPNPELTSAGTDRHGSGDRAGEDSSRTSGRHGTGSSEGSQASGESGSDGRSGGDTRDRDDGARTSEGGSDADRDNDSDQTPTTTSSGSGSDASDDSTDGGSGGFGGSDETQDSGDSGDSGGSSGSSGSDDGGGSDSVDGD